jgi:hypothetical protein
MSFGSPTFPSWATETNFPAGPNAWSGQPCKVTPTGDLFTPNTKPPAEWFNSVFSRIGSDISTTFTKALDKTGDTIPGNILVGNGTTGTIAAAQAGAIKSGVAGGFALTGGSPDWLTIPGGRPIVRSSLIQVTGGHTSTGWSYVTSQSVPQFGLTGPASTILQDLVLPVIDGATLVNVLVWLVPVGGHATLPAILPAVKVKRLNTSSLAEVDLSSTATQFATATTTADWNLGTPHVINYSCTQNNIIDTSQFTYWIELFDEAGTNSIAGDTYYAVQTQWTLSDIRPG